MACNSYLCPGSFSVWVNTTQAASAMNAVTRQTFVKVPEVLSWSLDPSTDDPTTFRTADTNNTKVSANCTLATEWEVTITTKICLGYWLYDLLLQTPGTAAEWYAGSSTQPAWWFLSWDAARNTAGPSPAPAWTGAITSTDPGIYLLGTPTAPGISGDNDSDETASAEFTIKVSNGPWFPNFV